jgi:hypothetical protein
MSSSRRLAGLGSALAFVFVLSFTSSAGAITGSRLANRSEAPWMVNVRLHFADHDEACSGEVIANGVVLTAAHCVSQDACDATVRRPISVSLSFADRHRTVRSGSGFGIIRAAGYACPGPSMMDMAVIRFRSRYYHPVIPIASPGEIGSLADKGVTAFGGGVYNDEHGWLSGWISTLTANTAACCASATTGPRCDLATVAARSWDGWGGGSCSAW